MAKSQPFMQLPWPIKGLSVHSGFTDQDPGTTCDALNVRGYDPTGNRLRGAQRAGHSKYVAAQCNGSNFIQNLQHISVAGSLVPSVGNSTRTLTGVAVAGGTVKSFTRAGFVLATNGTGVLSSNTTQMGSSILFSKIYYADGSNWVVYDALTNTCSTWTATAGSLPVSGSNKPRLIMTWRGRIVLSGIVGDPQNWFMSRQFVGTDFDYFPSSVTDQNAQQAVAGNNAEAGQCPDIVNCLIPYSDDLAIFGGDGSIWQMTNDPAAGGQFDRISDTVGMAFGSPWCKDAYGTVYFFGSRGGLYSVNPAGGQTAAPVRISSQNIDSLLMDVDLNSDIVRMVWDDRFQTVMFYITPTDGGETFNYAYDIRNQAFWKDQFVDPDMNPTAVHLMDGDSPSDRVVLLGGQDGYIRFIDTSVDDDDGEPISSYVILGPIQSNSQKLRLRELRTVLGLTSDPVTLELFVGHSAEQAFDAAEAWFQVTIPPGRGPAIRRQAVAQVMLLKLSNESLKQSWQYEAIYATIEAVGRTAGRQM